MPELAFALEVQVLVGPPLELGSTQTGTRRIVPILSGSFDGPRLSGTVVPGGADWQLIRPDGVAELEARYTLEAQDGTLISVRNRGLRHGPPEVMRRLAARELVDPASYYFRSIPEFDVPSGPHDWLGRAIFVATGERRPDLVVIRVFEVL